MNQAAAAFAEDILVSCRRYGSKLRDLRAIFSEYGLIKYRTLVECRWLQMLADLPEVEEVPQFDESTVELLEQFGTKFSVQDAQQVKEVMRFSDDKYDWRQVVSCVPIYKIISFHFFFFFSLSSKPPQHFASFAEL